MQIPTTSTQDTYAISVLKQSVAAMGSAAPGDSSATGTVSITAGPDTQTGTMSILTKGTSQTLEQFTTGGVTQRTVYSNGLASDTSHLDAKQMFSAELTASSQSALFPLPLMSAMLAAPDSTYQYVAAENIDGTDCDHIRVSRTFSSQPDLAYLASFTSRDIWISSATSLPVKMSYAQRDGTGATPSTLVELYFGKYQQVSGIQYPFETLKSLNGTPWMAITVSSVSFNTGLSDSTFSIQ